MLLIAHNSCQTQKIHIQDSKWHTAALYCNLFEDITMPFKDFPGYSNNGLATMG